MATNTAVLEGIAGKDATVRSFGSDQVCSFSISLSNGKNKDGSWKESTWVEVSYWSKYAQETADRIKKGTRVTVTGRIGLRVWEKDDKKGKELELKATDVSVHGERGGERGSASSGTGDGYKQGRSAGGSAPEDPHASGGFGGDDDLPF